MRGYGKTGAKIILTGEHAVVYNKAAIAIPFNSLYSKVVINQTKGENIVESKIYKGLLKNGKKEIYGIIKLVEHVNNYLGYENKGMHIKIYSNISIKRGLGSSASVSISIVKAMFEYYNEKLTDDLLINLSMYAERIHHNNPSGLDVHVLVHNKPVWFIKNKELKTFKLNLEASMVVVDSGVMSATKDSIEIVENKFKKEKSFIIKEFDKINKLSHEAKKAIKTNDAINLGKILNENHKSLNNIGVSSKILNEIRRDLIKLGAIGAKLTGGGIGGCIVGITKTHKDAETIKNKLLNYKVHIYDLGDKNES